MLAVSAGLVFAQTSVVTASHVQGIGGGLLSSGTLCFIPQATPYTYQGGSPSSATVCYAVTSGAIPGGSTIGDVSTMIPQGFAWTVQVKNATPTLVVSIPNVQTTGIVWNFDTFSVPAGTTASGDGTPWIGCQTGANYTQLDAPGSNNTWTCVNLNNTNQWYLNPPQPTGGNLSGITDFLGFSATLGAAIDAGISRTAPDVLKFGNGAFGDPTASLYAGYFYGDGSHLTNVPGLFSVAQFGATGNPAQDATSYVTAAVNQLCANGGGSLYYPIGTYVIGSNIPVSCSGVEFYGDGEGASIIEAKAGTYLAQPFTFSGNSISIHDLTFDGNIANGGSGMRLPQWSNSTGYVLNNAVVDSATSAAYIANVATVPAATPLTNASYWTPTITSLTSGQVTAIKGAGYGLLFTGSYTKVRHVEITGSGNFGITYSGSTNHHLVDDAYIHDLATQYEGNNDIVIGIVNFSGTLSNLKITNNDIERTYVPVSGPGVAGAIGVQANNYLMSGNYIVDCLQADGGTVTQEFDSAVSSVTDATISGNQIIQNTTLNGDTTGCLELLGQNIAVTGNDCNGYTATGIRLGANPSNPASGKSTISGNVLKGASTSGTAGIVTGYNSSDTVSNVEISGNYMDTNQYGIAVNQLDTGISLFGNHYFNVTTPINDLSTAGALNFGVDPVNHLIHLSNAGISPDSSWAGGSTNVLSNSTALYKFYTTTGNAWTIPAIALNHKGAIAHILFGGNYTTSGTPGNLTFTIDLGSTQVCRFTTLVLPASVSGASFSGEAQFVVGTAGSSGSLVCAGGTVAVSAGASSSTLSQGGVSEGVTTSGFNTTTPYVFDIAGQFSIADAANTAEIYVSSVRFEYPATTSF